ncbi:Acg family FMN-binding oxidoreductase [Haloarchaeobius litoreus]|uniref:Acg family FMN-binding oxidoreductase n=1 Tax=Haloarchaeobius litoreus TaxID=755306 RepID=A0ABD6DLD1_9EURY|nr:nitroreductase family protein [Haloarchaeobius litoreus]
MPAPRAPPDTTSFPAGESLENQATFLVRYAILAPSSHNSQPWAFAVTEDSVLVYADESRRLDVADPDGRELLLSVGCALENLVVAARRFGLEPTVEYGASEESPPSGGDHLRHVATVRLDSAGLTDEGAVQTELFDAIGNRRTNHRPFEDRPVAESVLARFEEYAATDGLGLELVTDPTQRREIATLQTRADEHQFDDPAYRRELGHWIGTGALGASWLTARIGQLAVSHLDIGEREGRKNSKLVTSAPVVAVLTTESEDVPTLLRVGQVFERVALAATSEGLAVHPMSQILEVDEFRTELTALLGLEDQTPVHLFRIGYAEPGSTRTPRRPLEDVLR